MVGGRISYDGNAKKVAAIMFKNYRPPGIKTIMDFSAGKMYLIRGDNCTVHKTKKPFRPACVPKTAKYGGSFYQGIGASAINEDAWLFGFKGVQGVAAVTRSGCIPIGENIWGSMRGVDFLSSIGFTNFTAGIKDPSVFKPPATCKGVEEDDHFFGEEFPVLEYLRIKHTA